MFFRKNNSLASDTNMSYVVGIMDAMRNLGDKQRAQGGSGFVSKGRLNCHAKLLLVSVSIDPSVKHSFSLKVVPSNEWGRSIQQKRSFPVCQDPH